MKFLFEPVPSFNITICMVWFEQYFYFICFNRKISRVKTEYAEVAELADALDSGSSECKFVWVQVPSPAPHRSKVCFAPMFFIAYGSKKQHSSVSFLLLLCKKSCLIRLFSCKRAHDTCAVLSTFCGAGVQIHTPNYRR